MRDDAIYLILQGRIGNQLFQYAFARSLQEQFPQKKLIVIDDSRVLDLGWENSLINYDLPDVRYVHKDISRGRNLFSRQCLLRSAYKVCTHGVDYMKKYSIEKKFNAYANKHGVFVCENGFIENRLGSESPILLDGFFQSEKYFHKYKDIIKHSYIGSQFDELETYPEIQKLRDRNSICVSVKVEHNVGSPLYDVCGLDYWKAAIKIAMNKVENPLFFICSDNIAYVLENLIDPSKFDYVVQDAKAPVHISLAAMSECKHFIIGNTTFGWWAQYLSLYSNKLVIAPSKWMAVEMPIDIYQDGWTLISA